MVYTIYILDTNEFDNLRAVEIEFQDRNSFAALFIMQKTGKVHLWEKETYIELTAEENKNRPAECADFIGSDMKLWGVGLWKGTPKNFFVLDHNGHPYTVTWDGETLVVE